MKRCFVEQVSNGFLVSISEDENTVKSIVCMDLDELGATVINEFMDKDE